MSTTITSSEAYVLDLLKLSIKAARQASGTIKALDGKVAKEDKLGVLGARNRCNEIRDILKARFRDTLGAEAKAEFDAILDAQFKRGAAPAAAAA